MKIGLNEQPWESMRSPGEIREEELLEAHLVNECGGPKVCWRCKLAEDEAKAQACADAFKPFANMFKAKK